jgi:hypothetical protein
MPRRQAFIVLATVGLAACSGGGGSDGAPSSPTSPGGGGTPTNTGGSIVGGWGGTTSQGRLFHMLVTSAGIPIFMVGTSVTGTLCTNTVTSYFARTGSDAPHPISNNAFSVSSTGTSGTLAMAGTLNTNGTASGTVTVNDTRCNGTLNGTWNATRATGADVNLTGTWNGTFASNLVSRITGSITLSQTGTALTGTYSIPNGAVGTVSGTVQGRMANMTLTQTTPGCPGTFLGYAAVMPTPETITYFYAGTDCLGAHTGGNGAATR